MVKQNKRKLKIKINQAFIKQNKNKLKLKIKSKNKKHPKKFTKKAFQPNKIGSRA